MRSGSGGRRRRSAAIAAMITALLAGAHVASARGAVAHTVIEGETLSGIAAANGITHRVARLLERDRGRHLRDHRPDAAASRAPRSSGSRARRPPPRPRPRRPSPRARRRRPCPPTGRRRSTRRSAPPTWPRTRPPPGSRCARRGSRPTGSTSTRPASLSAYRTWEQQSYLYDLYLAGLGAPANPPGIVLARVRDRGRPREPRDAHGDRQPRPDLRLGQGPRPRRVVARGLRRRLSRRPGARAPGPLGVERRAAARPSGSSRSAASRHQADDLAADHRGAELGGQRADPLDHRRQRDRDRVVDVGRDLGAVAEVDRRSPARPPIPPPDSRSCGGDRDRATPTSSVSSSRLKAASGGRAVTSVAPAVGCGSAGPKSGAQLARAHPLARARRARRGERRRARRGSRAEASSP